MNKNTYGWRFVALVCLLALASGTGEAQIILLPGQKQMDKIPTEKKPPVKPKQQSGNKNGTFITLPTTIKHKPAPKKAPVPEVKNEEKPLIKIEPPNVLEIPIPGDNFPKMPGEVTISSGDSIGDLLPTPAPPPEVAVSDGSASGATMPIFPKDTSSAIFMVMKTWQCENYDGNTLLKHALEVYGQEADDVFQIQGLAEEGGNDFLVSVEEEDITMDELLDILATKSGRDWGVDIPSRTIYFYPKGVKTDTYNVW